MFKFPTIFNHQIHAVLSKVVRKVQRTIPLVIDTNHDISKAVIVAGAARSGTTWLTEIVNYRNDYRLMFEPLRGRCVNIVHNFKCGQYLRPDDQNEAFLEPLKAILSGRLRNFRWVDRHNRKLICKKRLIKVIRGNLLLKWIKVHFPQVPIVLILRHPCAVANSRLSLPHWNWAENYQECIDQEQLVRDFLEPMISEIEKAQDTFEMHIFSWCIANYVPLRQFQRGEIHLVFYENLCTNPETEIARLFSFLGESYDEKVFRCVRAPSNVARQQSAVNTGKSLIDDFNNYLSCDQKRRAVEILSLFGFDKIYSDGPMPLVSNEQGALL